MTTSTSASFLAYLRVSTSYQGQTGVSLSEQRLAIEQYARLQNLRIGRWLTETQSASGRHRPVFREAIKSLNAGKAAGLIVHKIDRSARNLADWALLGELLDRGVDIHFVQDGLDLHSRGGRLAADIQAVIAADFIRNLREETKKGMLGRLRQGLYPFAAPLGYLDSGRGRPKVLDPGRADLVRLGFELYATGQHTLRSVRLELHCLGLRNHFGRPVSINTWSRILRNPFYMAELKVPGSSERFDGIHEPLVGRECFEQVQECLRRRRNPRRQSRHRFRYRGVLRCSICGRTLVGELQKGRVYYRCHGRECHVCVREDRVEEHQNVALFRAKFESRVGCAPLVHS